jgi:hypothetical protein
MPTHFGERVMSNNQVAFDAPRLRTLILVAVAVFGLAAGAAQALGPPPTVKPLAAAVHQASYDPFASSDDWGNG